MTIYRGKHFSKGRVRFINGGKDGRLYLLFYSAGLWPLLPILILKHRIHVKDGGLVDTYLIAESH